MHPGDPVHFLDDVRGFLHWVLGLDPLVESESRFKEGDGLVGILFKIKAKELL